MSPAGRPTTTFRIRRTQSTPDLAALARLLRATPPVPVGTTDVFAQLRLGLAGKMLAVYAEVLDGKVTRNRIHFRSGSAVELFAAATEAAIPGQVVLLPAAEDAPDEVLAFRQGMAMDVQGGRMATAPIPGGYRMSALVPLSLFGIDPACREFAFDCAIATACDVRGHAWRAGIGAWPEVYTRFALTHSRVLVARGP